MLQGKQPIIYGDGEQQRCFSYIDDCLYCLNALAFQDNVVGEVINIGPDEEPITINELAEAYTSQRQAQRGQTSSMFIRQSKRIIRL